MFTPPIYIICAADPGVQAVLGSPPRFYPFGEAPHTPTYPYAVYRVIGGNPYNVLHGRPDMDIVSLQIDVYAKRASEALQCAQALRDAIEIDCHITSFGGDRRDPETRSYTATFLTDWHKSRQEFDSVRDDLESIGDSNLDSIRFGPSIGDSNAFGPSVGDSNAFGPSVGDSNAFGPSIGDSNFDSVGDSRGDSVGVGSIGNSNFDSVGASIGDSNAFGPSVGDSNAFGPSVGDSNAFGPSVGDSNAFGPSVGDSNAFGPSVGDSNAFGPSIGDSNAFGPSVGDSNAFGPSVGDSNAFGPSVGDSNAFGPSIGDSNAFGPSVGDSNAFGPSIGDSNAFGPSIGDSNAFGPSIGESNVDSVGPGVDSVGFPDSIGPGTWEYMTIDAAQVSADATDFPVYVDLAHLPSTLVDYTVGGDIRVFKDDGVTELPREVVDYNPPHYSFDGVSDYCTLDTTMARTDSAYVVDFFVRKKDGITAFSYVMGNGNNTNDYIALKDDDVYYRVDGTNHVFAFSSEAATGWVDEWAHFRITHDGTNLRCYFNGTESDTGAVAASGVFFKDFKFFGGARSITLSEMDVAWLRYYSDLDMQNLVHDWTFNAGTGTTLTDQGPGAVDGTFTIDSVGDGWRVHSGELHFRYDGVMSSSTDTRVVFRVDGESGDYASTATYGRNAVWADYGLVAHDALTDSAGNNSLTNTGGVAVDGKIGRGVEFDGSGGSNIDLGSDASIDDIFAAGGTAQAWVRSDTAGENNQGRVMLKRVTQGWEYRFLSSGTLRFSRDAATADGLWNVPATMTGFHKLDISYDDASPTTAPVAYEDGSSVTVTENTAPSGALQSDAAESGFLGNNSVGTREHDGVIDEVRFRKDILSSDWIATEYSNQNAPISFYSFTNAESP